MKDLPLVVVSLPQGATVKVIGFANSGGWTQKIILRPSGGTPLIWTGSGVQDNQVIGEVTLPPATTADTTLGIEMYYDPGSGFHGSEVRYCDYSGPGPAGCVVGGLDGGSRPAGPAFWNTIAFLYWDPPAGR